MLIAIIADLLSVNRRILEDCQSRLKEMSYKPVFQQESEKFEQRTRADDSMISEVDEDA